MAVCVTVTLPPNEAIIATMMKGPLMAKSKGRPAKPGGEGSVVRLASDMVRKAKYLAAQKGVPLSDYLSDLLRPAIDKEFRKAARDLMDELPEP